MIPLDKGEQQEPSDILSHVFRVIEEQKKNIPEPGSAGSGVSRDEDSDLAAYIEGSTINNTEALQAILNSAIMLGKNEAFAISYGEAIQKIVDTLIKSNDQETILTAMRSWVMDCKSAAAQLRSAVVMGDILFRSLPTSATDPMKRLMLPPKLETFFDDFDLEKITGQTRLVLGSYQKALGEFKVELIGADVMIGPLNDSSYRAVKPNRYPLVYPEEDSGRISSVDVIAESDDSVTYLCTNLDGTYDLAESKKDEQLAFINPAHKRIKLLLESLTATCDDEDLSDQEKGRRLHYDLFSSSLSRDERNELTGYIGANLSGFGAFSDSEKEELRYRLESLLRYYSERRIIRPQPISKFLASKEIKSSEEEIELFLAVNTTDARPIFENAVGFSLNELDLRTQLRLISFTGKAEASSLETLSAIVEGLAEPIKKNFFEAFLGVEYIEYAGKALLEIAEDLEPAKLQILLDHYIRLQRAAGRLELFIKEVSEDFSRPIAEAHAKNGTHMLVAVHACMNSPEGCTTLVERRTSAQGTDMLPYKIDTEHTILALVALTIAIEQISEACSDPARNFVNTDEKTTFRDVSKRVSVTFRPNPIPGKADARVAWNAYIDIPPLVFEALGDISIDEGDPSVLVTKNSAKKRQSRLTEKSIRNQQCRLIMVQPTVRSSL